MSPSARNSTRSAIAAACASWVTITVVWPSVSTDSRRSARISPLVVESRLPVGSSANITLGRETSARATATRCCWPPDSSDGRWPRRSVRPTVSTSSSSHAGSGLPPASLSGSAMFSAAVSIGSRLKNWKMKPMWSRRSFVSSVSSRPLTSTPATVTSPDGRLVEAGEDVHQRRLARARRAHDGGQAAARRCRPRRRAARRRRCRPRRSGGRRRVAVTTASAAVRSGLASWMTTVRMGVPSGRCDDCASFARPRARPAARVRRRRPRVSRGAVRRGRACGRRRGLRRAGTAARRGRAGARCRWPAARA